MKDRGIIRMRLLRDEAGDDSAGDDSPCGFGLQDNRQVLHAGVRRADGKTAFDFTLRIAATPDECAPPVFTGPFAFGRPQDRFVCLAWEPGRAPGQINRIKPRLADIDWALLSAAQESGDVLEADLSGRKAGGGKLPVGWRLVAPEPDAVAGAAAPVEGLTA
jgi:hypothetical protein